jgi:hypothetical protein
LRYLIKIFNIGLLFLFILFVTCSGQRTTPVVRVYDEPPEIIPFWFKETPPCPAGVFLGVGYAGRYLEASRAREGAIERALKSMAKQEQIQMIFNLREVSDDRYRLSAPQYQEVYEESIYDQIAGNYKVLDSLVTSQAYFVLLQYPTGAQVNLGAVDTTRWGIEPDWVKQHHTRFEKKDIYGVGMVSRYSSWVKAWETVDEYARFGVARSLVLQAESENWTVSWERYSVDLKQIDQSCDITLRNSAVIARWYDSVANAYYSLCMLK